MMQNLVLFLKINLINFFFRLFIQELLYFSDMSNNKSLQFSI